jgi:hypothetical protein
MRKLHRVKEMVYIFSADEAHKKVRQLAPGAPARRPAAITPRPGPVVAVLLLFI